MGETQATHSGPSWPSQWAAACPEENVMQTNVMSASLMGQRLSTYGHTLANASSHVKDLARWGCTLWPQQQDTSIQCWPNVDVFLAVPLNQHQVKVSCCLVRQETSSLFGLDVNTRSERDLNEIGFFNLV